jgi:transcriptional regulator of arginine metabolism
MNKLLSIESQILYIVENFNIQEQKDLQEHLKKSGYDIPQATLSRHLKKLKIFKVDGQYKIIDRSQAQVLPLVLQMKVSDSGLIILHTHPSHAGAIAFFLDQQYVAFSSKDSQSSPIMGTVAGDDTVLIILKSHKKITDAIEILTSHFPYLRQE